jgi:hypothetical protein
MKEEALTLVQIDDLSVLTQRASLLPKLSEEFTTIMKEDDVSLTDLLQGLELERERIWREQYASVLLSQVSYGKRGDAL